MFFYFFPLGVSSVEKKHVWLAYVICAIIVYRFVLSLIFPQLQIPMTSYFFNPSFNTEFFAAAYQSLITPNGFPAWAATEHKYFCALGTIAVFVFWILFGSSFEMKFGKIFFVCLLGFAFILSIFIGAVPAITLNPTFWLGQVVTLFFAGMAFSMFLQDDVRIYYHFYVILGEHNLGTWEVPAPMPLALIILFMFVPMSTLWYQEISSDLPIRIASINPLTWTTIVLVAGAITGILFDQWSKMAKVKEA